MVLSVFEQIFHPQMLLLVLGGVLMGVVLGAIPGLSGTIGIALLLPITFNMQPAQAILTLGGIFMGGMYGGSITAILINVPGDLCATCTAMEGYPLAKKGRALEALYYSIFSSMMGGFFGVLCMCLFTPQLAKIALKFGPPEMFFCAMCGLAVVAALSGKNRWKAFFAAAFGMVISVIGMDPIDGVQRFTFGNINAMSGISTIPVCIGMFCFAEMFNNIGNRVANKIYYAKNTVTRGSVLKDVIRHWKLLIKSSAIGTFVGILPGIGASMAIFLSYGEAKRTSKTQEEIPFGTGNKEGIIAAESANNALVGGTMVPMLALGIPGSPTAAMIGSALTIHGLMCGPDLFNSSPDIAYVFMYGMLIAVAVMAFIGTFGVKYFSYILKIKMKYIVPVVFVFALFGTYALNNSMFEVIAAIVLGIIGAIFKRFDVPCAPVVIGAVLCDMVELNMRRSIKLAKIYDKTLLTYVFTRPLAIILAIIFVFLFIVFFSMGNDKKKKVKEQVEQSMDE
ncbi:MAG: tripartite tricarboxylate transporter permease [Oscillospiraceae bacterium]|nr:tripartite tricarboxylate transporter permease [Oscillospiraceae bacterium]